MFSTELIKIKSFFSLLINPVYATDNIKNTNLLLPFVIVFQNLLELVFLLLLLNYFILFSFEIIFILTFYHIQNKI